VFFDNLSLLNANESLALIGRFWSESTQIASPLGSFGLNFDIIETNILNLGVVIGVVIYLGGDVLTSLLNDRKQKILGTLKSADERFLEAQQKLEEAKQKVQTAQTKAIEIREQGNKTAIQAAKTLFERTEDEIRRLEEGKQATLRFEEEKAMSQVRQQVVTLSIDRAFNQLRTKMDASIQRRLIDTNINLLGKL
jgi:F-type H+-transporting ATPase subunit b